MRATLVSHFTQKTREATRAYHCIILMTNTTTDSNYNKRKIKAKVKKSGNLKVPEMHAPFQGAVT